MDDLIYRLRSPAWSWCEAFGSNLDKEETLADLNAAADRIEELENVVREARRFMDPGGDPTRLTHAAMGRRIDEALGVRLQAHAEYLDAEGAQGTFSKDLADAARLLQSSSCFGAEVCKSPPCACAESIAATVQARVDELTKALATSYDSLRDWLAFAEEELSEFDVVAEECSGEKLCPKCESSGCIKLKIDNTRSALPLERQKTHD